MYKKDISVRRALPEDARLLYEWATDPLVRKNAFNQDSFSFDSHKEWLDNRLKDPDTIILIGFITEGEKELPVGQVRFDIENGIAEIDYSIDGHFRGRGLGKGILKEAVKKYESLSMPNMVFRGIVKEENLPSRKAFEAAGFVNKGKELINDISCYIYETETL